MARSPRTEVGAARAALPFQLPLLLLVLAATASADGGAAAELHFARRGEAVATRDLEALRATAPARAVRVHEPYEGAEAVFEALPFARVLDAVYGEAWRHEEELLFTCRDGYQPTLPVDRVLAHRPWLAFARADQPDFTLRKHESGAVRKVALGPFYLVWENLDDARVLQEHDYGWPYQLVGIDLIRTRDRFPKMVPPADAPPGVETGFAAYRVHCSRCHPLFGEGGAIGPELGGAQGPVAQRDPAWLRAWVEDPESVRPGTRMEPLNPRLPDRVRTVDAILAYLRFMVKADGAGQAR